MNRGYWLHFMRSIAEMESLSNKYDDSMIGYQKTIPNTERIVKDLEEAKELRKKIFKQINIILEKLFALLPPTVDYHKHDDGAWP